MSLTIWEIREARRGREYLGWRIDPGSSRLISLLERQDNLVKFFVLDAYFTVKRVMFDEYRASPYYVQRYRKRAVEDPSRVRKDELFVEFSSQRAAQAARGAALNAGYIIRCENEMADRHAAAVSTQSAAERVAAERRQVELQSKPPAPLRRSAHGTLLPKMPLPPHLKRS